MQFTRHFLPYLPKESQLNVNPVEIEPILVRLLAQGQESHPDLSLDPIAFMRFLAECIEETTEMATRLQSLRGDELYLCCACCRQLPLAIQRFESTHLSAAFLSLGRMKLSDSERKEIEQRVREKLLVATGGKSPQIGSFHGWAPLTNWLRVIVTREAISFLRIRPRELLGDHDWLDIPDKQDNQELVHIKKVCKDQFKAAFSEAMKALSSRERNLLRLYYFQDLSIDEIGSLYQVHRATAARWIRKLCDRLLESTRTKLEERLRLRPNEFTSLMGLVQSNLELSVARWLGDENQGA